MSNIKIVVPPSIRKIASEVPALNHHQVVSWNAAVDSRLSATAFLEHTVRSACDHLAHALVDHLVKKSQITMREEHEGIVTKVKVMALTYDEMIELLYKAYLQGRDDKRDMSIEWIKP